MLLLFVVAVSSTTVLILLIPAQSTEAVTASEHSSLAGLSNTSDQKASDWPDLSDGRL